MQVLQVQLEIGADPAEVGRARKWARSRLAHSGIGADEPLAETLVLIVSELVTNAVVHTGCPAVLRLLLHGGAPGTQDTARDVADTAQDAEQQAARGSAPGPARDAATVGRTAGSPPTAGQEGSGRVVTVRVEVADACARPPRPRQADGDDTDGRGLALVHGLADRWGWEPTGSGKRIWCELDRRTPPRSPAHSRSRPAHGSHGPHTGRATCVAQGSMTAYEAV